VFEEHRSRLFGVAYRMLASRAEAEALVQEAYLRWHRADRTAIREPHAWLVTTTPRPDRSAEMASDLSVGGGDSAGCPERGLRPPAAVVNHVVVSSSAMPTFEMLWDCPYCGTKKLLGKTHRFCPGCGAPQDPSHRYFPADEDKVAVEDHEYVGADRVCGACGSAMSARARHCTQCGCDMTGASEVRRVEGGAPGEERPVASPATLLRSPQGAHPAGRGRGCLWTGLGLLGVAVIGVVVAALWTRPVTATVMGREWERSIAIERFGPARDSAWCDAVPAGAYDVSRERRQRETRRVEDGQDCATVRVDQGDGTFREDEKCSPRYREEAVTDDYCHYTVDRWSVARTVRAAGADAAPGPRWPEARLTRPGECRGCERAAARKERYVVRLRVDGDGPAECEVAEEAWRGMSPGSRLRTRRRVVGGSVACDGLRPAP
jgi:Sigma-70 region 2